MYYWEYDNWDTQASYGYGVVPIMGRIRFRFDFE